MFQSLIGSSQAAESASSAQLPPGRPLVYEPGLVGADPISSEELDALLELEAEPDAYDGPADGRPRRGWETVFASDSMRLEWWTPAPEDPESAVVIARCSLELDGVPPSVALHQFYDTGAWDEWDNRFTKISRTGKVAQAGHKAAMSEVLTMRLQPLMGLVPEMELAQWRALVHSPSEPSKAHDVRNSKKGAIEAAWLLRSALVERQSEAVQQKHRYDGIVEGHVLRKLVKNEREVGSHLYVYFQGFLPQLSTRHMARNLAPVVVEPLCQSYVDACLLATAAAAPVPQRSLALVQVTAPHDRPEAPSAGSASAFDFLGAAPARSRPVIPTCLADTPSEFSPPARESRRKSKSKASRVRKSVTLAPNLVKNLVPAIANSAACVAVRLAEDDDVSWEQLEPASPERSYEVDRDEQDPQYLLAEFHAYDGARSQLDEETEDDTPQHLDQDEELAESMGVALGSRGLLEVVPEEEEDEQSPRSGASKRTRCNEAAVAASTGAQSSPVGSSEGDVAGTGECWDDSATPGAASSYSASAGAARTPSVPSAHTTPKTARRRFSLPLPHRGFRDCRSDVGDNESVISAAASDFVVTPWRRTPLASSVSGCSSPQSMYTESVPGSPRNSLRSKLLKLSDDWVSNVSTTVSSTASSSSRAPSPRRNDAYASVVGEASSFASSRPAELFLFGAATLQDASSCRLKSSLSEELRRSSSSMAEKSQDRHQRRHDRHRESGHRGNSDTIEKTRSRRSERRATMY